MCFGLEDIFKEPLIPGRIFQMPFAFTREEKAELHHHRHDDDAMLLDYFLSVKEHHKMLIENCYYEENTDMCNNACHKY